MSGRNEISAVLADWYGCRKRDLPWRATRDPYRIWISEVILQQTRVAQGLAYYKRFTERFPDVASLAAAREEEVLKLWQGLGYYSRGRNLRAAAVDIAERFGGRFPQAYEDVRSLKGVGDYTAAAICSLSYDQPYAVVDGNVYRVLARLFNVDLPINGTEGKKYFAALAQELLDEDRPGLHNQAMMEFGALQCVPRSPDCGACPLAGKCLALKHRSVERLPVKSAGKAVKPRWFHYFYVHCGGKTLLSRRGERDIWQGLYEFPLIETTGPADWDTLSGSETFRELFEDGVVPLRVVDMPPHQLSHRVIHARFCEVRLDRLPANMERYLQVEERALGDYAVPRLIELFLEKHRL